MYEYFVCWNVYVCIYALHVYLIPSEGARSPKTGVMDGCELSCGCKELNSGALQDQQVLLTDEPSLQHLEYILNMHIFFFL